MNIEINQTLHGYQSGHQLLASSTELSIDEKKLLLFQSDLSGSNVDEGFDNYLSGYPLHDVGLYAFAKTWYANEMRRPGCVWTHTLLISFSDIGKIPDFSMLEKYFQRPTESNFNNFQKKLQIDVENLFLESRPENLVLNNVVLGMLEALYIETEKAAILPAKNSNDYKRYILDIWSEQWPRLRRNFTFCTGALDVRTIGEKIFDFQIVPQKNVSGIERKHKNIFISYNSSDNSFELAKLLQESSKNQRRKFLWSYGADIGGERKDYLPLLKVFEEVNNPNASIYKIAYCVMDCFPNRNQAKLLKSKLFGKDSMLLNRFTEREIIEFLLITPLEFMDTNELHVEERLLHLVQSKEISLSTFLDIWQKSVDGRIPVHFFEEIDISEDELFNAISENDILVDVFMPRILKIADQTKVWELSAEVQKKVLHNLLLMNNIERYIDAILASKSEVVFELDKKMGSITVEFSLNWLNKADDRTLNFEWAEAISESDYIIKKWISNHPTLSNSVYRFIFNYLNFGQIKRLNFKANTLLDIYSKLKNLNQDQVFFSTAIFSLGLDDRLQNSNMLIVETFDRVYKLAKESKIESKYWNIIPKGVSYDNDGEFEPFTPWFFFKAHTNKRKDTLTLSQCEILVRTVTNKFISESWDKQLFINAFTDSQSLKEALVYCSTFKAGIMFLNELFDEISSRRVKISEQQRLLLSKLQFKS